MSDLANDTSELNVKRVSSDNTGSHFILTFAVADPGFFRGGGRQHVEGSANSRRG